MKIDTIAVHAAEPDDATGAVAPPIHLATTFTRDADLELTAGFQYVREGNPTQSQLEAALCRLESAEAALAFASGMGAALAILQACAPGDRVIVPDDAYYGLKIAARDFLGPWGIPCEVAETSDLAALRGALARPARLVWLESPSNPLMKVTDLAGAIALSKDAGAMVVVDNTFATPVLQRPLDAGADITLQASTKYLGGHSDVVGGVLAFARRDAFFERVEHARHILGAIAHPFASWLVLRGLRTLACRVEKQSSNALAIARFLETHPAVEAVHYPGLPSQRGYEIAKRQMSAFGGMLSFRVRGGRDAALKTASRLKVFLNATSLGGTESLIEHRASSEGPNSPTPQNLLRVSVGLEHPDDLVEDLQQALES